MMHFSGKSRKQSTETRVGLSQSALAAREQGRFQSPIVSFAVTMLLGHAPQDGTSGRSWLPAALLGRRKVAII